MTIDSNYVFSSTNEEGYYHNCFYILYMRIIKLMLVGDILIYKLM